MIDDPAGKLHSGLSRPCVCLNENHNLQYSYAISHLLVLATYIVGPYARLLIR